MNTDASTLVFEATTDADAAFEAALAHEADVYGADPCGGAPSRY